jgi:hypothetical protein
MKKLLVTAVALGSLGLVACKAKKEDAPGDEGTSKIEAPNAQTVSFAITGMT